MAYDKSTLTKGLGASFAAVGLIVIIVAATGTAYAVPLAGTGGITIKADKISADHQVIYPGQDDTSEHESHPMIVVEQKNTKIEGLQIIKEIETSNLPGVDGNARFVIEAHKTVKIDEQLLKMSKFNADQSTFHEQTLDESPSEDPSEAFQILSGEPSDPQKGKTVDTSSQGGIVLRGVEIKAHYLTSSQISLPDQDFYIEWDSDGDGNYDDSVAKSDKSKSQGDTESDGNNNESGG